MDSSGSSSFGSIEYGLEKYGAQGVLASSLDLGWSGVSAALRTHERGVIAWQSMQPETEVCVAIAPGKSVVTKRLSGGVVDRTHAQRGMAWFSPRGLPGGGVIDVARDVSAPPPQILHIYLPAQHFAADSLGDDAERAAPLSLRYEHGFQDPLVAEIAFAIVSELQTQTAGGRLLAETLGVTLAARLVQRHTGLSPDRDFVRLPKQGLDRRRLTRVKEYIAENLEGELTITQLAKVACLSQFHFARAFKASVGQSPHQYVSTHRLERAKELLARGEQSLIDIAITLNFSSQANFTRAFHRGTGMTPGKYRRRFASLPLASSYEADPNSMFSARS
jgi:AraC family transcriptional regulator